MSEESDAQRQMLNKMSGMLEGVKLLADRVGAMTDKVGRSEAEFEKISRQLHILRQDQINIRSEAQQFRSEFQQSRTEMLMRLDAIAQRLEEIENIGDRNSRDIRGLELTSVSQYNSILNALQDSLNSQISVQELQERVEALERRSSI